MQRITVFIMAIFISLVSPLYANYADTYGFSAEGLGVANALCSTAKGWSSLYYNIAGLGRTDYCKTNEKLEGSDEKRYYDELAVNYIYGWPIIDFNHPEITWDRYWDSGYVGGGAVLDLAHFIKLPSFISSARFGVGGGSNLYYDRNRDINNEQYGITAYLAMVEDGDPISHNFVRYGRNSQCALIIFGAGFGFFDDTFGIGLGSSVWAGGNGYVEMSNVMVSFDQEPSANARMDIDPVFAPVIGVYGKIGDIVRLGASWRGELQMEIDPIVANVTVKTPSGAELVKMKVGVSILDFYTPHTFTGGFSLDYSGFILSFDLDYQLWSGYDLSHARKEYYADHKVLLPELQNIIYFKNGLEYEVWENLKVRGGYAYQQTVLKDNTNSGPFNFLDNNKHIFTCGAGYIFDYVPIIEKEVEINFGFGWQYLTDYQVNKTNPDNEIPGNWKDDAGNSISIHDSSYSFGGNVIVASFEAVMRW